MLRFQFTFQYGQIRNSFPSPLDIIKNSFTFQYGQIRNCYLFVYILPHFLNLHSSMVRLEIESLRNPSPVTVKFTFQYGQIRNEIYLQLQRVPNKIYIPVWLDQKSYLHLQQRIHHRHLHSSMVRLEMPNLSAICRRASDLHSSMVRLEMKNITRDTFLPHQFTFQYGQIRNTRSGVDLLSR